MAKRDDLEALLEKSCQHMERNKVIQSAPAEVRDWWGARRAAKKRQYPGSNPNIFKNPGSYTSGC